jgi:hypothetical protein
MELLEYQHSKGLKYFSLGFSEFTRESDTYCDLGKLWVCVDGGISGAMENRCRLNTQLL